MQLSNSLGVGMKILVVDDEITSRMKLQKIMGSIGECRSVENGAAALNQFGKALVNKAPYDLVSLDLVLPDSDGLEVLVRMRALEAKLNIPPKERTKILVVTAKSDKQTIVNCAKAKCDGFIGKPFEREGILQQLSRVGLKAAPKKQPATFVYDNIVKEFIEKENAQVLVVSNDPLFFKLLRALMYKTLDIKVDCVLHYQDTGQALKVIQKKAEMKIPLLVFTERLFHDQANTEFIKQVKRVKPVPKVIVLTSETDQSNLIYLHEIGVDSVITKPASTNNLIQKMAFTIKPQGKLRKLVQEAKDSLGLGEYEKVLRICEAILQIKPDSPTALMLRGDAEFQLGRRDDAVVSYEEAHQNSTLFLDPLKRLARVYKESDPDKYLGYLRKLDEISPQNPKRKAEIGRVHAGKGELQQAEHYFDEALNYASQEAPATLAEIANRIVDSVYDASPELSEKYLTQAIELREHLLDPNDMAMYNKLGLSLRKQGRWEEAVGYYQRALRVVPDDEGLYYNMAMAYMDGREFEQAITAINNALAINPKLYIASQTVCYNIARLHFLHKQYKQSAYYLKKLLQTNPKHQDALGLMRTISLRMQKSNNLRV